MSMVSANTGNNPYLSEQYQARAFHSASRGLHAIRSGAQQRQETFSLASAPVNAKSADTQPANAQPVDMPPAGRGPRLDDFSDFYRQKGRLPLPGDPEYADFNRACALACISPLLLPITYTAPICAENVEDRTKLSSIVQGYLKEVYDKYGCNDNYMPYYHGLPEYDPVIAKAMQKDLNSLVEADPECVSLIQRVGGIYPLPDHFDISMLTGNIQHFDPSALSKYAKDGGNAQAASEEQPTAAAEKTAQKAASLVQDTVTSKYAAAYTDMVADLLGDTYEYS